MFQTPTMMYIKYFIQHYGAYSCVKLMLVNAGYSDLNHQNVKSW